jgi:hypothetical protein
MMTNPHITGAPAEQHRADLLRHAEQHRLVQAAKARPRPTTPRALLFSKEKPIRRRALRWLRPSTIGVAI